jgi:hypothetical protein
VVARAEGCRFIDPVPGQPYGLDPIQTGSSR